MKLISSIMPTKGRVEFAARAYQSWLDQTTAYVRRELVILDDEEDPSFPDQWSFPESVKYSRVEGALNIPQKRNLCCEIAQGDIIMHLDSDDWSASFGIPVRFPVMSLEHR